MTAEPWASQLEALGGLRVFDSTAIPGRIVDVMVALPPQLFFNTQIPACLWFLVKDKSGGVTTGEAKGRDRRGEAAPQQGGRPRLPVLPRTRPSTTTGFTRVH